MPLSRPAFYSALGSCVIHSVALGFASTLVVSTPRIAPQPIKVNLIQLARPLPVGEGASSGHQASAPLEKPAAAPPAPSPPPQPKPVVVKPKPPRPAPPAVRPAVTPRAKNPEPPVETVQLSQQPDNAAQVAALSPSLPRAFARETEAASVEGATSTVGRNGGKGANEGTSSNAAKSGEGQSGSVVAHPDYGVNPKPPYPMLARRLGAQGVVLLRVQVREDGSVGSVELERSSGFALLDESATRTVRERWRFVPARVDGAPVASWVEVPIRFVLEDS
ncbi:MAG TPA: energy transducer TonB [Methylomirabilota bacterium]|nr:energy transducer TonB [Methylomirabilota bacterium]